MPAKDIYHEVVKQALSKDGWFISHDPLHLQWGRRDMYVDLGAEQIVAAEREGRKIAVEIKSFVGYSEVEDLRNAVGKFVLYRAVLQATEPERMLYLAVRDETFLVFLKILSVSCLFKKKDFISLSLTLISLR